MNETTGKNITLTSFIPRAAAWVFLIVWAKLIFSENHSMLLPESGLDLAIILIIIAAGLYRKKYSGFLPAFALVSYEVHCQAAMRVENFQIFYVVSWLLCTYYIYKEPDRAASLVIYHAGISFDPGSAVTMGVGMQAGISAAPVTVMFLLFYSRELLHDRISFTADSRHFLAVGALAWLAVNHYQGIAADLTSQFVAFSASTLLFFATCSVAAEPRQQQRIIDTIAFSGILVIGAALTNQALESATLGEFFSRRAWAGSLHPNHLATWCLAAVWVTIAGIRNNPTVHYNRRLLLIAAYLLYMVISGARIVLAIAAVSLALHLVISHILGQKPAAKTGAKPDAETKKTRITLIPAALAAIVLGVVIFRLGYKFDFAEFSRNERLVVWKTAAGLITQAPFSGHGVLQFALLPQRTDSDAALWVYDWNYPHTHQGLLELLLWGGIPLLLLCLVSWWRAFKGWQTAGMLIGFLAVSATLLADFTWRTPAMVILVFFYLLFPRQEIAEKPKIGSSIKKLLAVGCLAVMIWLMQLHIGFIYFNRALKSLSEGSGTWKSEIAVASWCLPFSVDARMQELLWTLSREGTGEEFSRLLAEVRRKFPSFWPPVFVEARRCELAGDLHTALALYESTLAFENVDLTGIRNARAALVADRLQDSRFAGFFEEAMARGEWGAAMLLNHPDRAARYRQLALDNLVNRTPGSFWEALRLARIFQNLARNSVLADVELVQKLQGFDLPEWLLDEVFASLARAQAERIAEKYAEADLSHTGRLKPRLLSVSDRSEIDLLAENLRQNGPASLRTLAWIRLEQADPGAFIAAYDQMLKSYNFRGKNYEDLAGQYLFARFAAATGEHQQAVGMLDKLCAFDAGSPIISRLQAECHVAMGLPDAARDYVNLARQQVQFARLDPFFRDEPRNLLWPQGDQWIFLFERLFRRHDPEARRYEADHWQKFLLNLETPE